MAQAGDMALGTPAETLAGLRENPELMTCTAFPNAGYDYYVSYDPETDTYVDRVVIHGEDVNDADAIVVGGDSFREDEILHHFQFLMEKEERAQENPMAAVIAQLMREIGQETE